MSTILDPRRREAARLAELDRLEAMRPEADRVLQELVDDAREVFGTDFCLVNLVASDVQYFRAWSGNLPSEIAEVKRNPGGSSMCRYVVEDEGPLIVQDFSTTEVARMRRLGMGAGVRFYAGTPLMTSGGHAIGSFCVLDGRPREFDDKDLATLRAFAKAAVGRLEALGAAAHEREAKESERQYRRNVFELANDAILIYSTGTGLILDANRRACEMYGIPQETLVGTDIAELSLEREVEEEHTREVQRLGSHRGFETAHRRADGARMHVSINSSTTEYSGQRAILSIVRDVTERKRTEESLRLSERSLAQAQRIAHIGNWEHELKGGRTHWSDEMYRIFGFAPQALVPSYKTFMRFVHPDDKDRIRGSIRSVLHGSRPEDVEYRIVRPDGKVRFVHSQYDVAYDGAGRPAKFSGTVHDVTDRKQVEKKLEEAEERYRLLVEQIPAVAYTDSANVPDVAFYTSPRIEALLGYTPEEWLGESLWVERLHPDDRDWVVEEDDRARAAEEPFGEEYRLIAKDGRTVWVRDESELLRDEAGRPLLWQGILLDITERKRAEETLRQSEERFRSLIQNAPDLIMVLDGDSNILYDSPSIKRLLGYEPGERIGSRGLDYVHPEDHNRAEQTFAEVLSNPGVDMPVEYRLRHKDGSWRHFEATRTNLLDDPAVGGIVTNCRDITERKRTEEALRESEERYRLVARATNEVIWDNDLTTGKQEWNGAVQTMFGYSPEELGDGGRWWEDRIHPDDRRRILPQLTALLEGGGESWAEEYRFLRKDGAYATVVDRAHVVRDAGGRPVRMLGSMMDITERKRTEEDLKESRRRLSALLANAPAYLYRCRNEPGWPNEFVSDYALELTGYASEELTDGGVLFGDLILEEDRQRVWDEVQEALAGHRRFELRYSLRRKDGEVRHVEERGRGLRGEDGAVEAIEGVVYDVTERVRAEEALRETEKRYRTLVEQIPAVTYVQEATGSMATTYVSPQLEAMLGYSPEECVSDPDHWIKILHPDDKERVLAEERRTSQTGDPFSMEYRQFAKDGRTVWIRDEATLVRDVAGEPSYWLGVQTDVTERRQTEEALRESEERHRCQARELKLLHRVRTALAQELEPAAVFRAVVEVIARTYGYTQVSAYRLRGETLELQHQVGYEREIARIPVERGVMGRVARTRQPVLLKDVRSDPEFLGAIEGITSEVCVPLLEENEVVGALNVESTGGMELSEDDLRLIGALAEHVNVALSRAGLHARALESEERFRSLIQNASDVVTLLEVDGTIRYISPSVERMLGYRPEELVGRNAFDYIHPNEIDRALDAFTEMLAEPQLRPSVEYRFQHKDGSWRYLESIGSNLLDDPTVGELVVNTRDITERRLWEEKLRETEERYRGLVETIPAITYVGKLDNVSSSIYISPQIESILGYTAEERMSRPELWVERLHPEDRERVLAANDHSNATGDPFDEEYRMITRDGREVWMHDASVVLRDAEGRPSYRQGVMFDVTERRETEEALQAFEVRLRTVIEQSPVGIHIFAPDGTSLLANGAWDELWYLDAEEAQHANVFEDEQLLDAGLVPFIERSVSENVAVIAPLRLFDPGNVGREGRPRWLRALIYPVKGQDGRVLETVLMLEDFTERKRAEDALKESELRYRAVVEQSAEAIWLFDPETKRVLEANAAFQEMLGYDVEELRGMTNYDFVDHSREDVDGAVMRKLQDEKTLREERKYRKKDGTVLDVEVGGTVISYRGKSVVCSVARDITERKRVEEEIKEANRRLSELATLRADFTAMVAHEIDTPLAVIRGYADVIATGELGPAEQERALSRIQAETEVLNALVGDVRVAASAERKDFAVNPRMVPVSGLLEDAARFVATLSKDHPIILEGTDDETLWEGVRAGYADPFVFKGGADGRLVWADRYRIGQVLRNLLTNAVKYSSEGTPIELRAVPDEAAGRVRIEVMDHGIGIHPDDMERIFEKFGRGRDPQGRKVAGLGLGLYLSRRILQAHGSDLTVNAAPGGGSVFSFELESA